MLEIPSEGDIDVSRSNYVVTVAPIKGIKVRGIFIRITTFIADIIDTKLGLPVSNIITDYNISHAVIALSLPGRIGVIVKLVKRVAIMAMLNPKKALAPTK